MKRLTPDALKLIKSNGLLYGEIANHLKIAPASLKRLLLENNDSRLVEKEILDFIKKHLAKMRNMDLTEKVAA